MIVPAPRFLAPSRHAIGKTSIEHEEAVANVQELRREPHVEKVRTVSELNLLTGIPEIVPFNASPLPVAGIGVIVGGSDGRVRFFDAALQREYWTRRLDAPVYSSPVAVPGATDVLVSSTAGMVCRMTLAGRSTWIASLSGAVLGTIAFSPDGATAYVPVFGQVRLRQDSRGPQPSLLWAHWRDAHVLASHTLASSSRAQTASGCEAKASTSIQLRSV